jgi:hypothetical protein
MFTFYAIYAGYVVDAVLFTVLSLCFPVSVGALLRIVFKKSDVRLVSLLGAMFFVWFENNIINYGNKTNNALMTTGIVVVDNLLIMLFILFTLMIYSFILGMGVKLVDLVKQQNSDLDRDKKLPNGVKQMLCNAAVILLSLSFIHVITILFSQWWLPLLNYLADAGFYFSLFTLGPEILLFFLCGFVVSPLFQAAKRVQWTLTLAVVGSFVLWVFHRYNFPESTTLLHRAGMIALPLIPPWFVLAGHWLRNLKRNPVHNIC